MRSLPVEIQTELGITGSQDYAYVVYLIAIDLEDYPIRMTNGDISVWYNGERYVPWEIDFDGYEASITPEVDKLSVRLGNVDVNVGPSKWVMNYEVRGARYTQSLAVLDSNGAVIEDPIVMFEGIIDGVPTLSRDSGHFQIYNHMVLWRKKVPYDTYQASCRHSFRDAATVLAGTDSNVYSCKLPHISNTDNKPITGTHWADYWAASDKAVTTTWAADKFYRCGRCRYTGTELYCDRSYTRCVELSNQENFGGFRFLPSLKDKEVWWGRLPQDVGKITTDQTTGRARLPSVWPPSWKIW